MLKKPLAYQEHNHGGCQETALLNARALCRDKNLKLTPLRESILMIVWQSHKPLGVYQIMELLSESTGKNIAPPTVYRSLDFLLEHGLLHRLATCNAFFGCHDPKHYHPCQFFICKHCHTTLEVNNPDIALALHHSASEAGFEIQTASLEVLGTCPECLEHSQQKP